MSDTPPRILVLDDEEHIRTFLKEALESAGYSVVASSDGEEGLRQFEEQPCPLVISDLRMPGRDGFEVLRDVRRRQPDTIVIILTGYGSVANAVALMREGAYGIVTKPCSIQEILITVEKGLRHYDLTIRNRELQSQLDRSQRLAMIGKLAAGVAHELNSPLDGVLRFVNLSLSTLEDGAEVRPWLEEARRGLDRMASIVRSLLTFSRNVILEHEEAGLRDLLGEAVRSLAIVLADRRVRLTLGDVPSDLTVPKGMIQVFTNILKNAGDAVPEDGNVLIDVRREGSEIAVTIRDDGSGIPEDIRARIFEPFFTTKDAGQGTGLGLPICARIMERFNGGIEVEDGVEGGTIVTLRLPITTNARLATVGRN